MKDLQFVFTYYAMLPGPTLTNLTLSNDPDGWDDVLVKYDRSLNYFGLIRSYSIPLRFFKEGAHALRESFYTFGIIADLTITIKKLDRLTMTYYSAYTAKADFKTFKDYDNYVEVTFIESGLVAMMKENEKTIFDITVPGARAMINSSVFISVKLFDVFEALINRITDGAITSGQYAVHSTELHLFDNSINLMSTEYGNLLVLNPTFRIKTSFSDFFKSIRAFLNVGFGITEMSGKQTVIIESLDEFFTNNEIHHFSDVKDFEFSVDSNLPFNAVKVGFPEQEYSETSMVNEANTTSNFNIFSVNSMPVKELDMVSVYRGDVTGILDLITTNPEQSEYEYYFVHGSFNSGTNIFTIATNGKLKKSFSGTETDIYNANITPARCLNVHRSFIESCINATKSLVFSNSGNENFTNWTKRTDIIEDYIQEFYGISLSPATAMFVPYNFKITVPLTSDLNKTVNISSTGYISFTYNGNQYKGYIMSAGVKLAGRGVVEMKLLASYDNDFSTLIR
jgi:hypothetical protein